MFMNIVALVFYTCLLGSAFVVGRWLERHEKSYDPQNPLGKKN